MTKENSFLGLFDWVPLEKPLYGQMHQQDLFSDGLVRELCPIAPVGRHDVCGWNTIMQATRFFTLIGHLFGALALVFLLPYQLKFTEKGSDEHKRIGRIVTFVLKIQGFGGILSLVLQGIRHYGFMEQRNLPPEHGYALTQESKFVFLPMFAMGFITPLINGLGKMAIGIPYKVSAAITLFTAIYSTFFAYPEMIRRMLPHSPATYEFQCLFELVIISVVYPLQDWANVVIYFKGVKNDIEHHANNVKMLTVIAFTAIFWFAAHIRIGDEGEQFPIPTFWRVVAIYVPFLVMVFIGSFGTYLQYFFGTSLFFPTEKDDKKKAE